MSSSTPKRSKKDISCCATCGRSLLKERHIRCLKCSHYAQCLQCLSVAAESHHHSFSHNFFVIEPKPGPIYCQGWDAHDEILLLFGIKMLGIGNWNDISHFMRTKTAADIEAHYTAIYIKSPTAPYPVSQILPAIPKPHPPPFDTRPVESCPSEAHEKHMLEKNKKEKTIPAEFNGFMPYRHEFEIDFNNDAESLVARIEFRDDEDTQQTFYSKISALMTYNAQLAERKFRTAVIEDWNIHYKEVKFTARNEKDIDPRFLNGFSPAEREIDSKIISIAPYLGYKKTEHLANCLHQQLKYAEMIAQRQQWQLNGIKSHTEGTLFSSLQKYIKDGKLPQSEIDNWNEQIEKYKRSTEILVSKNDEFLIDQELQLCMKEKIHPQLYMSLKCLLLREAAFRRVRKKDAIVMDPNHTNKISKVYDLLVSLGFIKC
ncbi:Myb-like DNA-binding domain containing protein [Tritrichomonas foetus]|uniref:Myb-like DNA-binding domain containing protein n=1 Tax=Tritrichomonas foetus TaxID=1144522 RepID=A0A1J4K2E6_9EUKA|nr:Myb-like DNA-binding domain containing protein [Tritrichomonas foetus]|eukprot:OHT03910.1 Myb-like DNA-binding domain containing protein [Tritrichomonas foetus]